MAEGGFRKPDTSAQNLERIRERAPAAISKLLPALLAESCDADAAVNLFERLCQEATPELFRLMEKHRFLVHYALTVFSTSHFLGETLIQNPDIFHSLAREKNLDRSLSREDFSERLARLRSRSVETDDALLLARFKKCEFIRIVLRDALGLAALAEVATEISALADVLIEQACQECSAQMRERYGPPQRTNSEGRLEQTPFAVLSLGKLGGNELNYSSDVDLLFLFGDGEAQPATALSNREYFIRLAQQVTGMLSRPTREGSVFRIDLRLRPQGHEGEPAVALAHALHYYGNIAHDWELQALLKARHSAGDQELARAFLRGVQPSVYRTGLNFAAVETALDSLDKISMQRRQHRALRRSERGIDVKLDRGGIRDIEFLVQCLQRVYGGEEPWLRSGGTLFSLQKLHDKNHISGHDFQQLNQAYEFLRRVEHRLQLRRGQQTHRLPDSEDGLTALARSVMTPAGSGNATSAWLLEQVESSMAGVAEIYQRLVHAQQALQQQEQAGAEFSLRPYVGLQGAREDSYSQILQRLSADSYVLYEVASRRNLSMRARRNLHRLFHSALTSAGRYAALLAAAPAVEKALTVFECSDYLSDVLIRHPELLGCLEHIAAAAHKSQTRLPLEVDSAAAEQEAIFDFAVHRDASYSEKLKLLREQYRLRMFATSVEDMLAARSIFDSLQGYTSAAQAAIQTAYAIAHHELAYAESVDDAIAILALGRLGTQEFDIGSDADLLFVRSERSDPVRASKVAEQVVDILSAYTQEGAVFPVDTRLRPRGAEGDLVTTPTALATYFTGGEAQAWEALSFTKLRWVAGSRRLAHAALEIASQNLRRFVENKDFLSKVLEMRVRLVDASPRKSGLNFKTREGGFYDIDFIASYLCVKHSLALERGNIRQRLHQLAGEGVLSDADCATLDYAAELFRTVDHVIRLETGRAHKSLPGIEHVREVAEQMTARILEAEFTGGLEAELLRVLALVREVYQRVMA